MRGRGGVVGANAVALNVLQKGEQVDVLLSGVVVNREL
jgi:hypothetical protein